MFVRNVHTCFRNAPQLHISNTLQDEPCKDPVNKKAQYAKHWDGVGDDSSGPGAASSVNKEAAQNDGSKNVKPDAEPNKHAVVSVDATARSE